MTNVGALDQVRRFLQANPEVHEQATWACDTVGCFAGWTVALNAGCKAGDDGLEERVPLYSEAGLHVQEIAERLLGLTRDESDALFNQTLDYGVGIRQLRAPSHNPETEALMLVDALINRDKGELTAADRTVLRRYCLPEQPAGDAA